VGVTTRPSHFPVSLPEPDQIRIAWRGGTGNWVSPSLRHLLRELAGLVPTGEATHTRRQDWRDLSDAAFDDQIMGLVQAGDTVSAANMLVRRRGYSTTEARRFVEELLAPAGTAP